MLGAKDKHSSYGLTRSLAMEERCITNLEILTQHLQKRLGRYKDHMSMENLLEDIESFTSHGGKMYY